MVAPRNTSILSRSHSVYLAEKILKDTDDKFLAFDALMHDAEEAYVGDMKTPLKSMIPVFSEIALQVDKGIRQKFAHLNLASEMQEKPRSMTAEFFWMSGRH